jgi:hypothetical protein
MRTLTVAVSESSWATYLVDVPDDFDEEDPESLMGLEEFMYTSDPRGVNRFHCTDGAVEARELTIEADEPQ